MADSYLMGQSGGGVPSDGEGLIVKPGGTLYAWKFGPYRDYAVITGHMQYDTERPGGDQVGTSLAYPTLTINDDNSYTLGGTARALSTYPVGYWYFRGTSIVKLSRVAESFPSSMVSIYYNEEYMVSPPAILAEGFIFSREDTLPPEYQEPNKTYAYLGSLTAMPTM